MTSSDATKDQIAHVMMTRGTPKQQHEAIEYLSQPIRGTATTSTAKEIELAQIIRELMDRLNPRGFAVPKSLVHGDPLAVRAINAIQGIPKP
jgi:hypothetical protein